MLLNCNLIRSRQNSQTNDTSHHPSPTTHGAYFIGGNNYYYMATRFVCLIQPHYQPGVRDQIYAAVADFDKCQYELARAHTDSGVLISYLELRTKRNQYKVNRAVSDPLVEYMLAKHKSIHGSWKLYKQQVYMMASTVTNYMYMYSVQAERYGRTAQQQFLQSVAHNNMQFEFFDSSASFACAHNQVITYMYMQLHSYVQQPCMTL